MHNSLPKALTILLEQISTITSFRIFFYPYDHCTVCWVALKLTLAGRQMAKDFKAWKEVLVKISAKSVIGLDS